MMRHPLYSPRQYLARFLFGWKRLGLALHFLAGAFLVVGMALLRASPGGLSRFVLLALALGALLAGGVVLAAGQQQAEMEQGIAWLQRVLARLASLRAPLNAETLRPLGADLVGVFPNPVSWILLLKAPGGLVRGDPNRRSYLEVISPAGKDWDPSALESRLRSTVEGQAALEMECLPYPGKGRRETWLCTRRSDNDLGIALAVIVPRGTVWRVNPPHFAVLWDTALTAVLDHLELLEAHYLARQQQMVEEGDGLRVRALIHELSRELQTILNLIAQPPADIVVGAEPADPLTRLSAYAARAANWVLLFREIPFGEPMIRVDRQPIALAEVIMDGLQEAQLAWPEVYFHYKGERDVTVIADDHLGMILRNVLYNAASFCRDEDEEVRLRVTREGREVRIWIEDDGPGLTRDQAETIFVDGQGPQTSDRPPGMRVGLTISREIARAYGGDLVCHPKEEGYPGGCFEIRLPYAGKRKRNETKSELEKTI